MSKPTDCASTGVVFGDSARPDLCLPPSRPRCSGPTDPHTFLSLLWPQDLCACQSHGWSHWPRKPAPHPPATAGTEDHAAFGSTGLPAQPAPRRLESTTELLGRTGAKRVPRRASHAGGGPPARPASPCSASSGCSGLVHERSSRCCRNGPSRPPAQNWLGPAAHPEALPPSRAPPGGLQAP